ncbi:uncharacterized protein LOC135225858 isoform X2 [Macrobrachium nipponense]|uniref:uncharacterized protein LOC135225858 isoform X2 n=1 Tax=Macrobrachium nipponense TaxID=159736 RepID=UPI0030C86F59
MVFPVKITSLLFMYFLLSLSSVESGSEAEIIKALEETQQEVAWKYIPLSGPSIDKSYSKNITAQIGKTAVLNCRVKYLGGKTVSWMRARDLHLLTVGRFTYTSDERFRAVHQPGSDDWLLKIHYAQERDAGSYECQVSTTPPLSTSVWLMVVAEPQTQVLGGPDLYINAGSTINLTCVVSHSADPPPYIFWYHQSELLSYDSPRGGITVVTEHGPTSSSRLLIQRATSADAGQYSCRPANAEPHQINVHIIPNEHPAAIHHKNGTSFGLSIHGRSQPHYSLILSFILALLSFFPNLLLLLCGGNARSLKCHHYPRRSSISSKEAFESYSATLNQVNETTSPGSITRHDELWRPVRSKPVEPLRALPRVLLLLLRSKDRGWKSPLGHALWNREWDHKHLGNASTRLDAVSTLRAACLIRSSVRQHVFPSCLLHMVVCHDGTSCINHTLISILLTIYIPKS